MKNCVIFLFSIQEISLSLSLSEPDISPCLSLSLSSVSGAGVAVSACLHRHADTELRWLGAGVVITQLFQGQEAVPRPDKHTQEEGNTGRGRTGENTGRTRSHSWCHDTSYWIFKLSCLWCSFRADVEHFLYIHLISYSMFCSSPLFIGYVDKVVLMMFI